jgi:hypothetical protein
LSDFGIISRGKNPADDDSVGGVVGSSNGVSERPARVRKLPAKYKDARTGSGVQALKVRRTAVITDDKGKVQPRKKKPETRLLVEDMTDTDQVDLNKGPKQSKTRVFSQASEDAQDTCANTEASNHLDDSGNQSTGEANTTDAGGCVSDNEEWGYSQLDKMATKDAQVRTCYPEIASTHRRTCLDPQKTQEELEHRWRYPNCRLARCLRGWKMS